MNSTLARLSRRRFAALVPAAAWLYRAAVRAADSALPASTGGQTSISTLIDTHTHFYDPSRREGVPWPPKDDKLLYRTVLPDHYRALAKPRPVTGTVVLEASVWVEDNQWILDLAARDPFIVGFVGNLPVGTDAFPRLLDRFRRNPVFRGIRVGESRLREGLGQPVFLDHLKRLVEADLSLDVVGSPPLLELTARLADQLPALRIIIDHLAGVRVDGQEPPADWVAGMRAVAAHPKVHAKVSGLVEGTGRTDGTAPADVAFYRPVLDAIWRAFREDRLIYGSNWPVSERFAPLAVVQKIVEDYFGSHGPRATEKVFWRNSSAFYRWRPSTGAGG